MSTTMHPVRANLSTLQDTEHSTDFPDSEGTLATILNGSILLSMTWSNLQDASINLTTPDKRRRDGLFRCRSQISDTFYQISDISGQEWAADCHVTLRMRLDTSQGKPNCTYG